MVTGRGSQVDWYGICSDADCVLVHCAELKDFPLFIQLSIKSQRMWMYWFDMLQVRVWELVQHGHRLLGTMKEHKATICCVRIKSNDKECITASSDGACIIWDLVWVVHLQVTSHSTTGVNAQGHLPYSHVKKNDFKLSGWKKNGNKITLFSPCLKFHIELRGSTKHYI